MCVRGSPIPFASATHKHRANYLPSRFRCCVHFSLPSLPHFSFLHSFSEHLQTPLCNSIHFQLEEPHFHPSSQTGNFFFLSDLLPSFPPSNFFPTSLSSSSTSSTAAATTSSPCVIFSCVYISISAAVICSRLTVFNGPAFPFHRGHMRRRRRRWQWWRVRGGSTKRMAETLGNESCRP